MTSFNNPQEADKYIDMVINSRGRLISRDENGEVYEARVAGGSYVLGKTKTGGTYRLFEETKDGKTEIGYESRDGKPTRDDWPLLDE